MTTDRTNIHRDELDLNTVGEMHGGQVRMAYRLAEQYRGELLYVYRPGPGSGWLSWDGSWWTSDNPGAPTRAVLDVLERANAERTEQISLPGHAKLRTDVAACESATGVAGVLALAAALEEFAITGTELDSIGTKIMAPAALAACVQRVLDEPHPNREQALYRETLNAIIAGADSAEVFDVMFRTAQQECHRVNDPRLLINSAITEGGGGYPTP